MVAYELELNDQRTRKAIFNATSRCTKSGYMIGTLFAAIAKRAAANKFQDKARYSFSSMFRHVWLVHRMARTYESRRGTPFRFILRARLDHTYAAPLDWPLIERQAAPSPLVPTGRLLFGQPIKSYRLASRDGVPHRYRCVMSDQFAVGPPALMDAYASVFPDYADFRRLVPLGRNDFVGHTNERVLVAHLHYRGAGGSFGSFPLHAGIGYPGCGTSHAFVGANRTVWHGS